MEPLNQQFKRLPVNELSRFSEFGQRVRGPVGHFNLKCVPQAEIVGGETLSATDERRRWSVTQAHSDERTFDGSSRTGQEFRRSRSTARLMAA